MTLVSFIISFAAMSSREDKKHMVSNWNPWGRQWKPSGACNGPLAPTDLVHQLPVLSCELSSNSRGRAGDRGNPECHRGSGHVQEESSSFQGATWQTLQTSNQGGSWRTMREWMWHHWAGSSRWEPKKKKKTSIALEPKLKSHWQKTRPSSHSDLSHAAARAVYLYFCCWTVSPPGLFAECLCSLIFVDVHWLLFWTWSLLYLGLLACINLSLG